MNSLLILATIAVLIQPCEDRDAFQARFGGETYGSCTLIFEHDQLPDLLRNNFSTNTVYPRITHSYFEGEWMQMDEVQQVLGYTGQGMNLSVMDGGRANSTHAELSGHVENLDLNSSTSYHATAVTQVIVGQGTTNLKYKGMAPGAYSYNRDYFGNVMYEKQQDFYELSETHPTGKGIAADNNSWGYALGWSYDGQYSYYCDDPGDGDYINDDFGDYTSDSYELDNLIFPPSLDAPKTVVVFSSGNERNESGYGQLHYHCNCPDSGWGCDNFKHNDSHDPDPDYGSVANVSCAKNVLAVGSTYFDDRGNKYRVASYSSSGPCDNGLIKPDFVAPGGEWGSNREIETIEGDMAGTSFAAPYITGIATVVSQKWKDLTGDLADVAVVRGVLAHTAEDLGNPGPDYYFGWGLPQVRDAIDFLDTTAYYTHARIFAGEEHTYTINKNNSEKLRCTLSWLDFAKRGGESLYVDLELTVTSGATTYYPYLLDKDNPADLVSSGIDGVNPIEMVDACDSFVVCDSSPAGTYTVKVKPTASSFIIDPAGHGYFLACSQPIVGSVEPCDALGEPNDTMGTAAYLLYGGNYATDLCPAGDVDYFTFDQFRSGAFSLSVSGGTLDVTLFDEGGAQVGSGTSISFNNLSAGAYVLKVASPTGSKVNYSFTIAKEEFAHGRPFSMP